MSLIAALACDMRPKIIALGILLVAVSFFLYAPVYIMPAGDVAEVGWQQLRPYPFVLRFCSSHITAETDRMG